MADEFKVSRGPVRDALRILEREGLVTLLARRGAIVTELSDTELRELLEIRGGLFEIVVRKIAIHPSAELLRMLTAGVKRLETLADVPRWRRCDMQKPPTACSSCARAKAKTCAWPACSALCRCRRCAIASWGWHR